MGRAKQNFAEIETSPIFQKGFQPIKNSAELNRKDSEDMYLGYLPHFSVLFQLKYIFKELWNLN